MSYVCLAVSKKGAVAAGDTRITLYTPLPFLHLHYDRGQKVFSSPSRQTIWAFTGITFWFFRSYPKMVRRIMRNEELSLEERLKQVKKIMCHYTQPPLINRIPIIRSIPFIRKSEHAQGFIFNLLYAHVPSPGEEPICGMLFFRHGKLESHKTYRPPVIMENGMNYKELSALRNYIPNAQEEIDDVRRLVGRRVKESIKKDQELHAKNRKYVSTIGGRVLTCSMRAKSCK